MARLLTPLQFIPVYKHILEEGTIATLKTLLLQMSLYCVKTGPGKV